MQVAKTAPKICKDYGGVFFYDLLQYNVCYIALWESAVLIEYGLK